MIDRWVIDRCICFNKSFRSILDDSIKCNITSLKELQETKNICNKCCMCNPYLDEAFETGETKFERIL